MTSLPKEIFFTYTYMLYLCISANIYLLKKKIFPTEQLVADCTRQIRGLNKSWNWLTLPYTRGRMALPSLSVFLSLSFSTSPKSTSGIFLSSRYLIFFSLNSFFLLTLTSFLPSQESHFFPFSRGLHLYFLSFPFNFPFSFCFMNALADFHMTL